MSNNATNINYMPHLDGLRALSVIGVLISHYGLGSQFNWLKDLIPWGAVGVRLFFVLSGFLITRILLDCKRQVYNKTDTAGNVIRIFYVRRLLRIFPLFYMTLLIAWIFDVGNIRDVIMWHLCYLSNTIGATYVEFNGVFQLKDPTSAHFWSLSVEEQFYLLWPAIIIFTSDRHILKAVLGMILFAPLWRCLAFLVSGDSFIIGYLPTCIDTLGVGALLAILRFQYSQKIKSLAKNYFLFPVGLFIFTTAMIFHAFDIFYRLEVVILDIGCAIIFGYVIHHAADGHCGPFNKLLAWAPLRYIGKISYGIYILHPFMTSLLNSSLTQIGIQNFNNHGGIRFIALSCLVILVASFSWHLYEAPIIRLKKRVASYRVAKSLC